MGDDRENGSMVDWDDQVTGRLEDWATHRGGV